jgi:multidrug efflux system membrane fusion protein
VVALSRDADTDAELDHGKVELVNNQIDPSSGTIRVKATFPNASETLWPGQFVNARVLLRTVHGALTIPTTAIQRGPQGVFVYVVKPDSTVEARELHIGQHTDGRTIVTQGLTAGERVVISNQYQLQPGTLVAKADGVK